MKVFLFVIITLMIVNQSFGHEIKISDELILYRLSEQSYVHSQKNNNGLVYINHGEAIIVSTPNSDIETQNLIDWVRNKKHSKVVGYIIDRWHPDAMEGLDVVHKNGINSYAYELTRHIAKVKGLPVPKIGFNPKQVIEVGKEKIICHFLGEAHTIDGIVVWIPSENILFGGNEIRNYHGWVGNIGDANLDEWSDTATNIKKKYGSAKIVIPGHGKYGGSELIDYTIALYKLPRSNLGANSPKELPNNDLKTHSDFFYKAESESLQDGKRILKNAHLTIQDTTKYVEIESPHIVFQPDNKRVKSEIGRLKIYDKKSKSVVLRTDVNYKKMIVFKVDNSVGLAVILREITNNNR